MATVPTTSVNRFARAALTAFAIGSLGSGAARADQDDPRLPGLFEALEQATDPAAASGIEQQIWRVWLEVESPAAKSLLAAGMTSMGGGEIAAAIAEFDTLVTEAPRFAEGWNKRATALYMAGRYVDSVRDIERVLALEPRHFGALSGMGLIFMQRGDVEGALRAFEAVLSVHPQSPSARYQVEALRKLAKGRGNPA